MRSTRFLAVLAMLIAPLALAGSVAAASPTEVTFHIDRDFNAGTDLWSASGAIDDAGTFVDDPAFFAGKSSTFHFIRTLTGSGGTLTLRGDVRLLGTTDPDVVLVTGPWAVMEGSGSYATAHGSGVVRELFDTAAGTITGDWTGRIEAVP